MYFLFLMYRFRCWVYVSDSNLEGGSGVNSKPERQAELQAARELKEYSLLGTLAYTLLNTGSSLPNNRLPSPLPQ